MFAVLCSSLFFTSLSAVLKLLKLLKKLQFWFTWKDSRCPQRALGGSLCTKCKWVQPYSSSSFSWKANQAIYVAGTKGLRISALPSLPALWNCQQNPYLRKTQATCKLGKTSVQYNPAAVLPYAVVYAYGYTHSYITVFILIYVHTAHLYIYICTVIVQYYWLMTGEVFMYSPTGRKGTEWNFVHNLWHSREISFKWLFFFYIIIIIYIYFYFPKFKHDCLSLRAVSKKALLAATWRANWGSSLCLL